MHENIVDDLWNMAGTLLSQRYQLGIRSTLSAGECRLSIRLLLDSDIWSGHS